MGLICGYGDEELGEEKKNMDSICEKMREEGRDLVCMMKQEEALSREKLSGRNYTQEDAHFLENDFSSLSSHFSLFLSLEVSLSLSSNDWVIKASILGLGDVAYERDPKNVFSSFPATNHFFFSSLKASSFSPLK